MKNLTNKLTDFLPFVFAGFLVTLVIYNIVVNGITNI